MNILVCVVFAVLVGFGIAGLKTGLIKMVFSLISTIVALLVAVIFSPLVADFLESNVYISGMLTEKVELLVESVVPETEDVQGYIDGLHFPDTIKKILREDSRGAEFVSDRLAEGKSYISQRIVAVIINSIAFAVTFFVALLVLILLCRGLDLLSRLPLLHEVNHIAGLAAGLAEGLLVVWIFFIVLTMFTGTEFGNNAMQMISEDALLSFLYDNNLLYGVITNS